MSRVTRRQNIRVVVEPCQPWPSYMNDTPAKMEDRLINIANQVARDIKRHVDDIDGAAVAYDRVDVCSFCTYEWEVIGEGDATEDEPLGLPVCCNAAQDEWRAL